MSHCVSPYYTKTPVLFIEEVVEKFEIMPLLFVSFGTCCIYSRVVLFGRPSFINGFSTKTIYKGFSCYLLSSENNLIQLCFPSLGATVPLFLKPKVLFPFKKLSQNVSSSSFTSLRCNQPVTKNLPNYPFGDSKTKIFFRQSRK